MGYLSTLSNLSTWCRAIFKIQKCLQLVEATLARQERWEEHTKALAEWALREDARKKQNKTIELVHKKEMNEKKHMVGPSDTIVSLGPGLPLFGWFVAWSGCGWVRSGGGWSVNGGSFGPMLCQFGSVALIMSTYNLRKQSNNLVSL